MNKDIAPPNALRHLQISLAKSGLRILAGVALCCNMLVTAGILFIMAEILGIVEELV